MELTVEVINIAEEINLADHNFVNKVDEYKYKVSSIIVNGKKYDGSFTNLAYDIKIGMQGNQPILVAVPKEIIADFKSEERSKVEIRVNKMIESERKYQEAKTVVEKAMNM